VENRKIFISDDSYYLCKLMEVNTITNFYDSIPICGNPLTDSVPLSRISLRWIRRPVLSSFSVEEDGTGSKLCSVNRTVSF